ncbi:MAG: hypothetical protein HN348_06600 [Proteobacteria bacterium]|nr:hypothetical protein [Pseudomonadota bacterium]
MVALKAQIKETFHTSLDVEKTRTHFADFEQIKDCTRKAERFEQEDGQTMRFFLREQNHGTHKFRGEYSVHYEIVGGDLVWKPVGTGNLTNRGRARFRSDKGGTAIDFEQEISLDYPIGRLAAKLVRPIVNRLSKASMRRYVLRMICNLEGRPFKG